VDSVGLEYGCGRTDGGGHGEKNALRICIFCDMSGVARIPNRRLQREGREEAKVYC
jgi:hypothetical protein